MSAFSLNTKMSAVFYWTHTNAVYFFFMEHRLQPCRLLFYSLSTTTSSTSFIEDNTDVCFPPLNRPTQQCRLFCCCWKLTCVSLLVWLAYLYIYIYIFYFDIFPQSGMFPTTDRAAGRSGADDGRKQRAEWGDSEDDDTVPRPDGVTLQRSRGAQWKVFCLALSAVCFYY